MRIYRLQVRLIQLSVLLAVVVIFLGAFDVWNVKDLPGQGNSVVQAGSSLDNENPGNSSAGSNGDDDEGDGKLANTKIVCLGDSYTYGYPGEQENSWPQVVAELLDIEVVNSGVVYQNSDDLLQRFDDDVISHEPGRVVIFAGVGDAIRGIELEVYQKNLQAMVQKAEETNIEPILALPIPYLGTETLYNQYRDWEIDYASEKGLDIIDFKTVLFEDGDVILRKYADSNNSKYPSKDGYRIMGEYAAQVLQ